MSDKAKRDAVQGEFYAQAAAMRLPYEYCHTIVVDSMTDEIVRLRTILDKLREPSDAVLVAAHKAYVTQPDPTTSAIRAAVAAAEQEVDHG